MGDDRPLIERLLKTRGPVVDEDALTELQRRREEVNAKWSRATSRLGVEEAAILAVINAEGRERSYSAGAIASLVGIASGSSPANNLMPLCKAGLLSKAGEKYRLTPAGAEYLDDVASTR